MTAIFVLLYRYQLYRDAEVRDLHFDVGYAWQTAYMSPNEGGSGASTPMYLDFCKVLLGWHAVRNMATGGAASVCVATPATALQPARVTRHGVKTFMDVSGRMQPTHVSPEHVHGMPNVPQGEGAYSDIEAWARHAMQDEAVTREVLERYMVAFQRNFLGGRSRSVEAGKRAAK